MSFYQDNFVNSNEILRIIQKRDNDFKNINSAKSRRIAQYGYEYTYTTKTVNKISPIPPELNFDEKISEALGKKVEFDQLIINEYKPKQSIAPHIDSSVFGPIIACISVGADGKIVFGDKTSLKVKNESLYVMEDYYRYETTHQYTNNTKNIRYSLTYRTV